MDFFFFVQYKTTLFLRFELGRCNVQVVFPTVENFSSGT